MAVLFALLTALANAVTVTSQHVASTGDSLARSGWRFILFLVRHPLWLAGWAASAASLVCQATALHFGPLSLVQPFLVTELVMALLLRRLWFHQRLRRVTWVAAAATTAALALFLVVAAPRGGAGATTSRAWIVPIAASLAASLVLVALARTGSPFRRAGLYAGATAILWALSASLIKSVTDELVAGGVGGLLARWPLYAFVAVGVAGLVCEQAALHVGPLKVSQPVIVIVDPLVSIALGVGLYGERLHTSAPDLALATLAFAVMAVGAVVLTRSAPDTMRADDHPAGREAP